VSTGAREAVATEFLRKALAGEAVAVPKLDMMARAAGLLGECQRITQAKLFRRAKHALGIRSVREGFGKGGGWSWELPSDAPATISATTRERSAREPAIPREWLQGVARLEQDRPPADVPRHRWDQFVEDCRAFLRSEALAHRAAQLGWDAVALFGCCRNPLMYLGKAGLLWQVSGGKITDLHGDWAMIERPVNRSQSPFSRRDVDKDRVVLPWTLPLVKAG
jgi:hypothetical protein